MVSKVDICNLALGHIGQNRILALNEGSIQAKNCTIFFDSARDDALRGFTWGFATVIAPLSQLSQQNIPGWSYAYAYPSKCLAVWKVFQTDISFYSLIPGAFTDFREMYIPLLNQKVIVSHNPSAFAEYTHQVEDTNLYDANFVSTLAFRLAADLAHPLCGDKDLGIKMTQIYLSMISEAKRNNWNENRTTKDKFSSYVDSRG